ncbi:MAG: right-handed parallel beta-helix repeat-containing protein [Candidatus Zixiibacteriota bacterium]
MNQRLRGLVHLMAAGALLLAPAAWATTRNVPADFATVQGAINAASNGDTVLVQPGRYVENISFLTKNLVVASRYITTHDPNDILNTILDGSSPSHPDTASVVRITEGQDNTTVLMGFTITGGKGTRWRDISDHALYREGGGIIVEGGSPVIANNYIVNNEAINKSGSVSAGGGAIRAGFGVGVTISGNVIAFNRGFYGAGIVSFHCPAEIKNNVIWKNSGGEDFGGSGVWMWNNSLNGPSVIVNNTIVANTTTQAGGGLSLQNSSAEIYNNIFRDNTGSDGPQIWAPAPANPVSAYNDVQGGFAGTSNTDENPLFAATNLLLTSPSPCVDSGDPTVGYNDIEDLAHPGQALSPSLGTTRNDKGAYGGGGAPILPLFTSARFNLLNDTIDLGSGQINDVLLGEIRVTKDGYMPIRVDSVVFKNGQGGELAVGTPLPKSYPIAPIQDSIRIFWQPSTKYTFVDTALVYHNVADRPNPLQLVVKGRVLGCCVGTTGNVDMVGAVNLGDLSFLVAFLTGSGGITQLPCAAEANINGVGAVDLSDLSSLVAFLTGGGFTLPPCPL